MKTSHPQLALAWCLLLAAMLLLASCQSHRPKGTLEFNSTPASQGAKVSFWSADAEAYPVSLKGRRVLLVGDSMAQGLAPFLQRKVEAAGGQWASAPEQSSTIIWWQGSGKLRELISEHRPDIIFIALGSNELYTRDAQSRASVIQKMVAEIGSRQAYWIGPPTWKPGATLVPVIEDNFQPGHFYNSDTLDVPRAKDGKHPTGAGYERWVELIWQWYARAV